MPFQLFGINNGARTGLTTLCIFGLDSATIHNTQTMCVGYDWLGSNMYSYCNLLIKQ